MTESTEERNDPFDPEITPAVQLIVQMRIYDVLLGIYTEMNKEKARELYNIHADGKIVGSLPSLDLE